MQASYFNHSCRPNCQAVRDLPHDSHDFKLRMRIVALRDIAAGEELSISYLDAMGMSKTER